MARIDDGKEFSVDDPDEWGSLLIDQGCIVEAGIEDPAEKEEPIWGGFLVMGIGITHDASLRLHVKSLGCADPQLARELSSTFNRKEGYSFVPKPAVPQLWGRRLPCEAYPGLQCRRFCTRLHDCPHSESDQENGAGELEEEETEKPPPGPKRAPALRPAAPKVKERRAGKKPGAPHKAPEGPGAATVPSATEEAKRALLRERLRKAKESMAHGLVAENLGRAATRVREGPGAPAVQDVESSSEGYSASIAEDGPSTGTCLTGTELDRPPEQVTFADRPVIIPKGKREEEDRWGPKPRDSCWGHGYKRWRYDQLADATHASSSGEESAPSLTEEAGGVEAGQEGHWIPALEDPYQVSQGSEGQKGEEGQEKQKEAEACQARGRGRPQRLVRELSDAQWRRRFRYFLKQLRRRGQGGEQDGSPAPTQVVEASGQCVETPHQPRSATTGPNSQSGSGECSSGRPYLGGEDSKLLQHHRQAKPGDSTWAHQRDVSSLKLHRSPKKRRTEQVGRCARGQIYQPASVGAGRWLAGSQTPGGDALRRGERCWNQRGPSSAEARPSRRKGAGCGRVLGLAPKPEGQRRKRKVPCLERDRLAGSRQRETERSKGPWKRKGWLVRAVRRCRWRGPQEEGEARREMIENKGALALAGRIPQSPLGREGVTTQAFKEGLLLGTSLPRMACMLAWWLVMPCRCLEGDSFTSELFQGLLKATVTGAQRRPRPKGAVFPLREGDLMEFIGVYKKISLQEATSAAFVERWQKQALLLCMCGLNALNGTPTLPVSGRWTQAERAAAGSIASAVDRRLATFVENEALTESAWQKDMKSR